MKFFETVLKVEEEKQEKFHWIDNEFKDWKTIFRREDFYECWTLEIDYNEKSVRCNPNLPDAKEVLDKVGINMNCLYPDLQKSCDIMNTVLEDYYPEAESLINMPLSEKIIPFAKRLIKEKQDAIINQGGRSMIDELAFRWGVYNIRSLNG